ncbi:carotenoid oxygenase family protein [Paludibaculum fermentans]|uniref:Carotenoid oxygenase family protein n=1 Tax=Paludibaculum fermentans TaxID=1473598 RepID=A0A7S7NWV3_PALFE|nr:carotenoid oxygenase family protein [Paludibaculum fermentans]QOY91278.1 carotenoid oxygenase family protein [Paludibaculum fermentans]
MTADNASPAWVSDNPFLHGPYAPVFEERDDRNLPVQGEIPRDLNGAFLRNGPNPQFAPEIYQYPMDGTGMVHAIYFEDGQARYRNRWVRTTEFLQEQAAGHRLFGPTFGPPPVANLANTHIIRHAGRYLALWEGGLPHLLDRDLNTLHPHDFDGRLPGAMSAHPKFDPDTGEMVAVAYDANEPRLDYLVVDRHGVLTKALSFDGPWPAMIHDVAITRNYVVAFVCPYVLEQPQPQWRPALGTAIAVIPRRGGGQAIRWLEAPPFFHFHVMNAFERDHYIEVQLPWFSSYGTPGRLELHRLRISLENGATQDEPLDDCPCEFPRINDRFAMRENRFGYVAFRNPRPNETPTPGVFEALARYDLKTGSRVVRTLPAGEFVGEPVFVPAPGGTAEDDGYVITFVYNARDDRSSVHLYDARDLYAAPVAQIPLPARVPAGLHGSWVPEGGAA